MNKLLNIKLSQVELPSYKETYNTLNKWVKYGDDNLFPQKLQELLNRSALHRAIVSSKVKMICGKDLFYEKKKDSKTDTFLEFPNGSETLKVIFKKIAYDYVVYGGYAINIILSKDKKSIAEIYHVDFAKVRAGFKNEKGIVDTYYFSNDWANYRRNENTPKSIPAYNTNSKEPSQLLYVSGYSPGMQYYPLPEYVGALSYIEIDSEISNFHLSNIKNGMSPSMLITMTNGDPTEEEKSLLKRKFEKQYTGSDNAGRLLLYFAENKDTTPVIQTISPSELDKQFIQLQETVLQNILAGHSVVSPLLVGIKTEGQIGGASELENAYQIYSKTIIEPMQEIILESINKITKINELQQLLVQTNDPIQFSWSENILKEILTVDEMREKIGLEPIKEEVSKTTPEISEIPETSTII